MSKMTSYRDFHTQLYTCSPEFDFLPLDYPIQLTSTLLLPAAAITCLLIGTAIFQHFYLGHGATSNLPEQTYYLVQSLAFVLLAILIMRLKLFLTPHLCLVVAILARSKVRVWRESDS